MRRWLALGACMGVVAASPASVRAGGFEFPDHSATAMARGGSAVAETEGASALYFNPAGLGRLDGLHFELDGELVLMSTSFQRRGDDGSGSLVDFGNPVGNSRNPWIAPFLGVAYGGLVKGLTFGAGVYGPSAFAWQRYPDPRNILPTLYDGNLENNPDADEASVIEEEAPQRYNLIDSTILVLYPSVSVAYAPVDWFSVGLTGQLVIGSTSFSQAIYGGLAAGEDPLSDAIADLDVKMNPTFTGIVGLQLRPTKNLSIGASWRPGFSARSEGTLDVTFNDSLVELAELLGQDLEQTRNETVFLNDFPHIVRFGVAYGGKGWLAEVGGTFEDWSTVRAFIVEPDVEVWFGDEQIAVENIVIPKEWNDSWSLRVGGRVELGELLDNDLPLTIRAGFAHETSAVPTRTLGLDFISGARNQLMLGVSYDVGPLTVSLAGSQILQPDIEVTDSELPQNVAPPPGFPEYESAIIGNGTYEASYTVIILGLEGHFGGAG